MSDETLRRAAIIEALYRSGAGAGMHDTTLAGKLWLGLEALDDDLTALHAGHLRRVEAGCASAFCWLSDAAIAVMDLGARAAAECVAGGGDLPVAFMPVYRYAAPAWSPHLTLADCAAWAEAIVVACEAEGWTGEVYLEAMLLQRFVARRLGETQVTTLATLRDCARDAARHRMPWVARAYSAIIAVRMLAAEAARREQI